MPKSCMNIGCNNPRHEDEAFCFGCLYPDQASVPTATITETDQRDSTHFLQMASAIQEERANEYDAPNGKERSMAKVVQMFNALTGHQLTETEGWRFMELLKMVRAQGKYHEDSLIDGVSYAALAAESHYRESHVH